MLNKIENVPFSMPITYSIHTHRGETLAPRWKKIKQLYFKILLSILYCRKLEDRDINHIKPKTRNLAKI